MNSWIIALHLMRRVIGRRYVGIIYLLVPCLIVGMIFGLIGKDNTYSADIRIDWVDQDQGSFGKLLHDDWALQHNVELLPIADPALDKDRVAKLKVDASIHIPPTFTADLLAHRTPELDLEYAKQNPGTHAIQAVMKEQLHRMNMVIQQVEARPASETGADLELLIGDIYRQADMLHSQVTFGSKGKRINSAISASMGMMLMFIQTLVIRTVSIVVEDRRNGTMERVYAAPVHAVEIAAGHLLGSFLLGSFQIAFVLLFGWMTLSHDLGFSFIHIWIILEAFLLAALGVAAAVAGFTRSQQTMSFANTIITTPACMIGGCFWPLFLMPDYMQKLANFVPQKWAMEAIELLTSGYSLTELRLHLGILLLFAAIFLSFGFGMLKPGEREARG